jgi:hypothetical protein
MIIPLEKIKTALRLQDIEGYIAFHGAPDNEYDSEAEEIFSALNSLGLHNRDEQTVIALIIPIWTRYFNLDDSDIEKRLPDLTSAVKNMLV